MLVVVQMVKGDDTGGSRRDLNDDQAAGRTCCACAGPNPTDRVGWIAGSTPAHIHSWCLEHWRGTPNRAR